jgi:DNA polymerase III alpha subunit
MGVPVLQPDINSSMWDFDIEDVEPLKPPSHAVSTESKKVPSVRFGLGAIKNVGANAVQKLSKNAPPTENSSTSTTSPAA